MRAADGYFQCARRYFHLALDMEKENEDLITPHDSLDLEKTLKALEDVQVPPACSPVLIRERS